MKISLNTIRSMNERYHCCGDIAPDGVDALVKKIGAQLGEVEEVTNIGKKYEGIIIAKVVSCEKHPNADRLNICLVDDGGKIEGVTRNEQGRVQVVCGAPNVRTGLTVAWLPPGATVPESYDSEPFVLDAREIRGVVSNGMLASPKELAISDNHDGILEINEDIAPGTSFAEQYGLKDDVIIEIENKMFTHRPDCFGFLGVARELAGIQHMPFKSPEWYDVNTAIPAIEAEELPLEVDNQLPDLVPRFTAITLRDVRVGPSPLWLQVELAKLGQRSINNIVDYTNYFMLETGQPMHAFDYDKIEALSSGEGAKLVIRYPHQDEKILLLNGKEITPRPEAMLISTDQKAVSIAGVMGGGETEVDEHTKNIIIECANFDMYSIRRTSMAHGLFTDAVTRFNKGQSPLQNRAVVARIVDEIRTNAGGKVASNFIDILDCDRINAAGDGWTDGEVAVTVDFVNSRLGLKLTNEEIVTLLQNVGFGSDIEHETIKLYAPFWRTDIEIPEDIVEEVGRLYGYDHLPLDLPRRSIVPVGPDELLRLKFNLGQKLASLGANEVLSYSFVPERLLRAAGQNPDNAFRITNALSPDLQYYRQSLTPSLLEKVHPNIKAGHEEFALFELGKTHHKGENDPLEPTVPKEVNSLSFVHAAGNKKARGVAFYQARTYLDALLSTYGREQAIQYVPLKDTTIAASAWMSAFDPNRSAVLVDTVGVLSGTKGSCWGVIGEYKASVAKALKLPNHAAGFEVDPLLFIGQDSVATYAPLPQYPAIQQDITLKVASDKTYEQVVTAVQSAVTEHRPEDTTYSLLTVDLYQSEYEPDSIHYTFRISLVSDERTLTTDVANVLLDAVAQAVANSLQAQRI